MDHRCPHCRQSLRWRWVRTVDVPGKSWLERGSSHEVCPRCGGAIVDTPHPAMADDWLWARWLMPAVALEILALLLPSQGWLFVAGGAAAVVGGIVIVIYTVRERLRWVRYRKFEREIPSPGQERAKS